MNAIKQALEDYASAYVFTFENMRNQRFKEFREQHKSTGRYCSAHSDFAAMLILMSMNEVVSPCYASYGDRFFLGSNKVMQIALGRSVADEVKPGIHKLSKVVIFPRSSFGLVTNFIKIAIVHEDSYPMCSFFVVMLDFSAPIWLKRRSRGSPRALSSLCVHKLRFPHLIHRSSPFRICLCCFHYVEFL